MRFTRVSGDIIAELTGQHRQGKALSPALLLRLLQPGRNERYASRCEPMALALWYRYGYEPKLSYPQIAREMGCHPHYVQKLVHSGLQRLLKYPYFSAVTAEKGSSIEVGTQLYVDLFGCELRCCEAIED